ncbi:MAG: deoxyribodipyrimidine photo-lyase [Spongiibacteraceae bacterium]
MQNNRALMWFRSDLRVFDNTALRAASQACDELIACFCICPGQWRAHDMAPIQSHFIYQNLLALAQQLSQLNIPLKIIKVDHFSQLPAHLHQLCQQLSIGDVYANQQYAINEKLRDEKCQQLFENNAINCHWYHDFCAIAPGQVLKADLNYYKVFTPFSRQWKQQFQFGISLPPAKQQASSVNSDPLLEHDFKLGDHPKISWQAGEQAAQAVLKTFVATTVAHYKTDRDIPSIEGTSSLSPYLALGVISPRQCLSAAYQALKSATASAQESIYCWINELIWRDFYQHIVDKNPHICRHQAFKRPTDQLPWRKNTADFERWCHGQTGIPIIDAAMRQLLQTGWMHNRLRMICAMFLSKNLFIDWRWGEQFFMRHLIDGEFAANNGGWQWSASTGTDAVPYFRVFNPVTQSQRFDPNGHFIRRFVPELSALDNKSIHMPKPEQLANITYPAPMVDLKNSRLEAISHFKMHSGHTKTTTAN